MHIIPPMQVIASAYLESLQDITTNKSTSSDVAMFSSVSGDLVNSEDLGPSYWVNNMTSTVEFFKAVQNLQDFAFAAKRRRRDDKSFVEVLVEVGPHAALQGPLKQITDSNEARRSKVSYLSLLSRGVDAYKSTLEAVGQLYIKGYVIDLWDVNNSRYGYKKAPALLTDLPSYPWSRTSRYWYESHLSTGYRFRKHPRLDLLGAPTPDSNHLEPKWRNFIRKSENPWVLDHKVRSTLPR
jgi:acyl transferase domain-containing protein